MRATRICRSEQRQTLIDNLDVIENDYIDSTIGCSASTTQGNNVGAHHPLIEHVFENPLPVSEYYQSRFKPPYFERHVFYASESFKTAVYESAFYFMLERIDREMFAEESLRLKFRTNYSDICGVDLNGHHDIEKIMNRDDWTASHEFIISNPEVRGVIYPSCREPQKKNNMAIFEIEDIDTKVYDVEFVNYQFENNTCYVRDFNNFLLFEIEWSAVSS